MATTDINKKLDDLFKEIGLNSIHREYYKSMDQGSGGNKPDEIITRERLAEAERCFNDPVVSACFLILAFSLMKKKIEFKPIQEGLKRDINKSKKMAESLNFSLEKLEEGGTKQLIFDLFTSKFFGWSLVEKVYNLLDASQSKKWNGYYYYEYLPAKRIGLWDFEYNEAGRVIGYVSLVDRRRKYSKRKFLRISYLPLFGNPNGKGDFSKVWKYWDAKCNVIMFMVDLSGRLSKGRQAVLKDDGSSGKISYQEKEDLLDALAQNLNIYVPNGYTLTFSNFDTGALQYFLQVLRWLDSQIAIAMLGSSLAVLESQGAGTNAQSQVHTENKYTYQEYVEGLITDEFDSSFRNDLLKLNFNNEEYPEEIYPKAHLVEDKQDSKLDKAKLYQILKDIGVIDADTQIDLNFLREEFELPDNPELFEMVENIINKLQDLQDQDNDPDLEQNQDLNNSNVGAMYK